MPDCDGLETIEHFRKTRPDVKIIAISGAFDGQFLDVAAKLGAHGLLTKPLNNFDLLEMVGALVGKKSGQLSGSQATMVPRFA